MLTWLGGPRPKLWFDTEFTQDCDVLYDVVFGITAVRYNINTIIEDGTGDVKVGWTLTWEGSGGHTIRTRAFSTFPVGIRNGGGIFSPITDSI